MTPDVARSLFRQVLRIRHVEQEIARRYAEQRMRCPVHLSIGQEATSVAVAHALRPEDTMVSPHRAHAHYLAKGGSLVGLIAELYGKRSGCAKGQGGSMHLVDLSCNFLGSTSIVGGTIPIGVGVAFANHLRGERAVTVVYLGDTAVEEGVFHESMNFAALHRLAVLFVCENNFYSCYSPLENRQPKRPIADVAKAHGVRAKSLDGNDVLPLAEELALLVAPIRDGEGPAFVETLTYRWLEHCGPNDDDHLKYRPPEEVARWKARDPVALAREGLLRLGAWTREHEDAVLAELGREVEAAFAAAESAPFPEPSELGAYVHAR